ncbi:MAG: tRNA (N(6)-L-threonylcarbamoyladenosine(37)-C(2))-methylthiotransferase MtaB [Xanthomonadaceae bacterium]|nr:tRNA (N(6)-L-threonylcarbamoyladenosine(37)-C(2))-methylthiotransferase MtaB [Xanthomonadaceae bacterium]
MQTNNLSKSYLIKTLGCKANFSDSQALESELQKRGWIPAYDDSHADLCIVNSCTVTNEADKQSRGVAKRVAKKNPKTAVVFTGCGAEVDPSSYKSAPGIHYVMGNQNKPELIETIIQKLEQRTALPTQAEILGSVTDYVDIKSRHPIDREWPMPIGMNPDQWLESGNTARTRVFLKIQEGCNSFCTYCIIPYGRGPNRSLRPRIIVDQINNLVKAGVREVVLTGTNIGDYGTDWSENGTLMLDELIKQILDHTSLERLRVSSLDPTEITDPLMELMESNSRFCPHFHVSLQSPHSKVLKLMKRKYDETQARDCLTKLSKLKPKAGGQVFVGMDLITGFPGEGETEFQETYDWLKTQYWNRLHVFPYSERVGTPATKLTYSVPKHIRSERAKILMELSLNRLQGFYHETLRSQPKLEDILAEGNSGYTPHYLKVMFDREIPSNELVSARPYEVIIDRASGDVSFLARTIS